MRGWKVVTHDRRSPIQGGDPLWSGDLPADLPDVMLDTSDDQCGPGWNFCRDLPTAFRIAGLWPDGRPSRAVLVEPSDDWIERGDKCRASALRLVREATDDEIRQAITTLSEPFGEFRDEMVEEQLLWRHALSRPRHDKAAAVAGLRAALGARGLEWDLREYPTARSAWSAWDAWAACDALNAWDAWAARAARVAWTAWSARVAWATRAAWNEWSAWSARDAWAALTTGYASRMGWIAIPADRHIIGIRDAYESGLEIALPTGPNTLGYAMAEVIE